MCKVMRLSVKNTHHTKPSQLSEKFVETMNRLYTAINSEKAFDTSMNKTCVFQYHIGIKTKFRITNCPPLFVLDRHSNKFRL